MQRSEYDKRVEEIERRLNEAHGTNIVVMGNRLGKKLAEHSMRDMRWMLENLAKHEVTVLNTKERSYSRGYAAGIKYCVAGMLSTLLPEDKDRVIAFVNETNDYVKAFKEATNDRSNNS